jgi:arylsulfatase A
MRIFYTKFCLIILLLTMVCSCLREEGKLYIVTIFADDFGVGNIQAYYPDNEVNILNLDQLINEGLGCTDAYRGLVLYILTHYGLLIGRYAWRFQLQNHILHKYDAPLLKDELLTLPEIFKELGYKMACINKWHLGHNWIKNRDGKGYDYSVKLTGGDIDYGFDYYFGTDVSNYESYTFIEN